MLKCNRKKPFLNNRHALYPDNKTDFPSNLAYPLGLNPPAVLALPVLPQLRVNISVVLAEFRWGFIISWTRFAKLLSLNLVEKGLSFVLVEFGLGSAFVLR